jgi:hypothetical protein
VFVIFIIYGASLITPEDMLNTFSKLYRSVPEVNALLKYTDQKSSWVWTSGRNLNRIAFLRFEVFTAVTMKNAVF